MRYKTAPRIQIEALTYPIAGACGGDQFGSDGLTEILVDDKFWGFVHWSAGSHFAISKGVNTEAYWDLGWRKNRRTARLAALKEMRKILRDYVFPKRT